MWRAGYCLLLWLALPWVLARLWWRGRREAGYRDAVATRFGIYGEAAPTGPLIWVHAVSVGETRAAEPLIKALLQRYPSHRLLLTHMTASGRETARQLYREEPRIQFAWLPYDFTFAVKRFVRHFRPRLGVIMETEIWLHLLKACAAAGVPMLLANARMSPRSADGYVRIEPLIRQALSCFSAIAAQTQADACQLHRLGAQRITVVGNLKFEVEVSAGTPALAAAFRARYGARKVLLAASTREGEEELILEAVRAAGGLSQQALLVIVPRHPQRFQDVADLLVGRGLQFVRRSAEERVPVDCNVVLGDSMGEMAGYYASSDCAFIGGSLLDYGGQNLIEACAAGVPVLVGPHTYNFAEATEAAIAAGAALRSGDAPSVIDFANRLLDDEAMRGRMAEAGLSFCHAHRGATASTLALCERLLPRA